jgi:hypothetical protein
MRFLTLFLRSDVMSKKLNLLISFVLTITLASISYGAADPRMIKLDLNNTANNDDANTQIGFTKFILSNSGSEVNGVVIDLRGNIRSARRNGPNGEWYEGVYYPRAGERIYRDFIYGINPSGVTITLWELGTNRDCNVTIWAFDDNSTAPGNRIANWYANGTHILDTNFIGGEENWPGYEDWDPQDLYKWAFSGRATTDELGRITLTSSRDPCSPANQPFAFVNAIKVEPNILTPFVPTKYARLPVPFDGARFVPVNTKLRWRNGAGVAKHDLYIGDNFNDVNTATRASHPGVLSALDLADDANKGYDPYDATGFLKLDTTYYWRVDENSPPNLYKGVDVWSFKTCPNSVEDNFDSYESTSDLIAVWKNCSCAVVYLNQTTVRSGKSMEYQYKNYTYWPYYSEANATIGTGYYDLKIDPNWLGMEAKALSLWFYGTATNDANEEMYIKLVDSDTPAHTATVGYKDYGDMNDVREAIWHEWNIPLADFAAANPSFNLHKVAKIIIGFGDGTPAASDGIVYFEDIQLYNTRCVLAKRSADFAKFDYAPLDIYGHPGGDCKVDYQELEIINEYWLDVWYPEWFPPPDFVEYWPMNEGAGNKIFTDPCDPRYTGTFSPSGVTWATPGAPSRGGEHALRFNGDFSTYVSCGKADLGIGPTPPDVNAMTLSIWVKWLGPRTWDAYLFSKMQGMISKSSGWSDTTMMFRFEVTPGNDCSFALRHYMTSSRDIPDLYAPNGILTPFIGRWVHLAATFDGTTAKLYLNGIAVKSGPWRFSHGEPNATDLTIGNNWNEDIWPYSPESFYGYLDEPRIYKRVLTATEIRYMAGREPPIDLYSECWGECPIEINFMDLAVLMNYWLEEDMFP